VPAVAARLFLSPIVEAFLLAHRQLLDTLPETPENLAERAAVCARIVTNLARLGDPEDQATSLFEEGRELATRSGDPLRYLRVDQA
jgi:hypothetical protein